MMVRVVSVVGIVSGLLPIVGVTTVGVHKVS